MSKDRLLSNEELGTEIRIIVNDMAPNYDDELLNLINTQKRLYAESVIGEDEKLIMEEDDGLFERIRNLLRAEQRARIK